MIYTAKRALVTGGARGIGLAASEKLASQGLEVILTDINRETAQKEADRLMKQYGVPCFAAQMDVSHGEEVNKIIGRVTEERGSVDVLVNNAGICYPAKPLDEIKEDEWLKVFQINILGMVHCVNAVIPSMKEKQFGKIINMSSSSGFTGGISVSAAYSVSKAGVMALTKNMAKQFGPSNINVNALSPGIIESAMTENLTYDVSALALRRFGTAGEVADLVAFLASDESSYLTGTTIDINGGLYMR